MQRACARARWTSALQAATIGQKEIVGPGKLLRRAIEADRLFSSILLWGQPGTGKTTLADGAQHQRSSPTRPSDRFLVASHFETLSAVLAGGPPKRDSAELREVIDKAQERRKLYGKRTILFVK